MPLSPLGFFAKAAGAAGSFESIATVTSGSSSVTFSSIPQTYKHLQIRILGRTTDTGSGGGDRLGLQINSVTSNYTTHELIGDGSSATAAGATALSVIRLQNCLAGGGTSANTFGVGIVDILEYTDINKNKTIKSINGYDLNGSGTIELISGLSQNTAAVTSITLYIGSTSARTFATGTSIALYGIKG